MEVLAILLAVALAGMTSWCVLLTSSKQRLETERDQAMGRAVQAETAANKLFDRYSDVRKEQLESKVPTVPRIHSSRPPPPPRMPPKRGGAA